MAGKTVSTLKFVGSISVGLLTGLSYTLSALTLPTLLHLPSAPLASKALSSLSTSSSFHLRALAGISGTSFLLAYVLSPRSQKHPYLLWSTLFIGASVCTDYILPPSPARPATTRSPKVRNLGKSRQMDASYEVLGTSDRESEGAMSEGDDGEDEVNGEEIRERMEGFTVGQVIRTAIAGVGFAMSVVGIWGDGAADLVIIEL